MATVTQSTSLAPVPHHVPEHLVVDFDLYDPPGAGEDFHGAWKRLQDEAPDMIWTPRNGGHWIALRGKLIHEIFADFEHFSSKTIIVPRERGDGIKVLPTTLDPPEHRPYRALLNAGLSPRMVRELEPDIRDLVVRTVEQLAPRGKCEFVSEFAEVLPINIFMMMVDLPLDDALMMKGWVDDVLRPESADSAEATMQKFSDYLKPVIRERTRNPGNDLISQFVTSEVNGAPLPEHQAIELGTQVLMGGLDTVISSLGFIMLFLARNPGHRRQLIDDPSIKHTAVEEFFRRFGIVQNGREVLADLDFHGVHMRGGDLVIMPNALHGLDDREYERSLDVDFRRKIGAHSTFGNGAHRCPGAMLARSEVRITLEEWLPRIPDFRVDETDRVEMEGGIVATVNRLPLRWD
ncbi:cytochrome P450 [Novosphingobium marinum]|uniref:Cytochrome P450 n=1 Tax=Novosphingobium marinum TaxID=1514948 RepID=A0A7Z0BUI6_9SPHN|nr:cytochrome P450 [Novosphingobium marinum]NYH96304.1 cytochrome P450 [Novosphingobium marinum]GGC34182.1 cytochrome P450 [Novosphingobium marinum]